MKNMGFRFSGKAWTREDEADFEQEYPGTKKGKCKAASSTKRKGVRKIASPPRKSTRLAKGKTMVNVIEEEKTESSQSLVNPVEPKDSLEISEGVEEVPQE